MALFGFQPEDMGPPVKKAKKAAADKVQCSVDIT